MPVTTQGADSMPVTTQGADLPITTQESDSMPVTTSSVFQSEFPISSEINSTLHSEKSQSDMISLLVRGNHKDFLSDVHTDLFPSQTGFLSRPRDDHTDFLSKSFSVQSDDLSLKWGSAWDELSPREKNSRSGNSPTPSETSSDEGGGE